MSETAISIEGVGKRYRIGTEAKPYKTFREALISAATAPFRALTANRGFTDEASFWALKDVNFEVRRGEVMGIVGRNGAGKSTLLKILSQITEPTEGKITLNGRVGSLLEVGTGFHPELTGRENIFLNGAILGMTRGEIRSKFDEIVDFSEIGKFIDTPVKQYSSGMYTRLAFAVAANLGSDILVVDEVLAVGDASFQQKCLKKMRGVTSSEGRTVLFVSHQMPAIRNLCDRVTWLKSGSVHDIGDTAMIIDAYMAENRERTTREFDLKTAHRTVGHGKALRMTDILLNRGNIMQFNRPFSFRLRFHTTAPISRAAIGVGFSSPDGTRIVSFESDLAGEQLELAADTTYTVTASVENLPLSPGTYLLDVGVRDGYFTLLDSTIGVGQVEVAPLTGDPSAAMHGSAGVRLNTRWDWAAEGESDQPLAMTVHRAASA